MTEACMSEDFMEQSLSQLWTAHLSTSRSVFVPVISAPVSGSRTLLRQQSTSGGHFEERRD